MPESFENRLNEIRHKAQLLTHSHLLLARQYDEALRRIDDLTRQVESYRKQVEDLNTRIEYLQVASVVEQSEGDLKKSREFLSELVWEIDKCITQLSE